MSNIDRRKLLHAGVAIAVPIAGIPLLSGCQPSSDNANNENSPEFPKTDAPIAKQKEESKEKKMQIQYLEIVTPDVDALCKQYSAIHGVTFGDVDANLGNARTAKLDGGMIGIRAPMRETETPVVRPYTLVENLDEAVTAAKGAGAEIAIDRMEIPGHGSIAIFIQGGIECGLWQSVK